MSARTLAGAPIARPRAERVMAPGLRAPAIEARWLGLLVLTVLALSGAACRRTAPESRESVEDASRQEVRAFWQAVNAATAARMSGDCASAVTRYDEALALDPRHEDALYYLGQCQRTLGRPLEARSSFERLVEVNPHSARGHLALGALLASPDAAEPMDLAAAEEHLRRAHAINGEETGPVVRLGEVLLVSGHADAAGVLFEAALRTNPKSVEAAFLGGLAARELGRSADAARFAARVRDAAKVEAPVKGVLNEGDRRDQHRAAAPPLKSPLGRLLFGNAIAALHARAQAGEPLEDAFLDSLWREATRVRQELSRRATTTPSAIAQR